MKTAAHHMALGLFLAATLGLSGAAFAVPSGHAPGMNPEKQATLEKMYNDFAGKTQAMRQQLIAKQHELNSQLYSPTPDDKKIESLTKEISELRARMDEAHTNLRREMIREGVEFGYRGGRYGYGGGMMGGCGPYAGGCGPAGGGMMGGCGGSYGGGW